jgi:hypothetical protein
MHLRLNRRATISIQSIDQDIAWSPWIGALGSGSHDVLPFITLVGISVAGLPPPRPRLVVTHYRGYNIKEQI